MSENTSIQEGGGSFPFGPVVALMVKGDDDKYYSWYPESSRQLDSLSVEANGVYQASKQGVYGWSSIYINVLQTDHVTGTDPDTGEEVVVRTDPETGEIVETVIPSEIRITTLPTKTSYAPGEAIDMTGATIKAYSATSQEMQTVPISEIRISPTVAPDLTESEIAVSWPRPGDGAVLETSFDITITGGD